MSQVVEQPTTVVISRGAAEAEGWLDAYERFVAVHPLEAQFIIERILLLEEQLADEPPEAIRDDKFMTPPLVTRLPPSGDIPRTPVRNSAKVLNVSFDEESGALTAEDRRSGDLLVYAPVTREQAVSLLTARDFDAAFKALSLPPPAVGGNVHDTTKQCRRCEKWFPESQIIFGSDPRQPNLQTPIHLCQGCRS